MIKLLVGILQARCFFFSSFTCIIQNEKKCRLFYLVIDNKREKQQTNENEEKEIEIQSKLTI